MKAMRDVYMVAGGVSKFDKARHDVTFQAMVKEAFDYACHDRFLKRPIRVEDIDGSVASYFSDHFMRQLKAGAMVQDYLGLCPKPSHRVEGGGATGGLAFQEGWKAIASGYMDACVVYGWETMSHVETWKGNEFIALASDVSFDYPVGGFYTGYYAMMVVRHMKEFGTTAEQLAHVSVKNYRNAFHNPYAQKHEKLTIQDVRNSPMVAWPLTRRDICVMSDGAAVAVLCDEKAARTFTDRPVRITGIGRGTDAMRMADRPHEKVILLPWEDEKDYKHLKYPGVHSFRAGRAASKQAYEMAGIADARKDLDFIELHDAYSSSELQTYEDMGLCQYGEGGRWLQAGNPFMPRVEYGLDLPRKGTLPVNPSGGLIACGHPVGATGLMQAVFALWQLQERIGDHFGDTTLQVRSPQRGAIHSHAGTGTYVTVSILERAW